MPFLTHVVSRRGRRESNQDAAAYLVTSHQAGCWVLADGAGGHRGGEVAAETATRVVLERFQDAPQMSEKALRDWTEKAQGALHARQSQEPALANMRTTLVVLVSDGQEARWGHVGDSRLYAFRDGRLVQRTLGHSVPEALAQAGQISDTEARRHPDRTRLLRALGQDGEPELEISDRSFSIEPGDAFLLCSDGLWEAVPDLEIEADLAKAETPEAWLDLLEDRVLMRLEPEHDNYTMLAVWVTS